jgi:hypothetical protein
VADKPDDPSTNDSKVKVFRVNNSIIYSETAVSQIIQLYSSGGSPTRYHAIGSKAANEFSVYTYDSSGHRIWTLPLTGGAPLANDVTPYGGRYPAYMIPVD